MSTASPSACTAPLQCITYLQREIGVELAAQRLEGAPIPEMSLALSKE